MNTAVTPLSTNPDGSDTAILLPAAELPLVPSCSVRRRSTESLDFLLLRYSTAPSDLRHASRLVKTPLAPAPSELGIVCYRGVVFPHFLRVPHQVRFSPHATSWPANCPCAQVTRCTFPGYDRQLWHVPHFDTLAVGNVVLTHRCSWPSPPPAGGLRDIHRPEDRQRADRGTHHSGRGAALFVDCS